jgi:hypothetical protein
MDAKLSYIELINDFWHLYDDQKTMIKPAEISVYFMLLRYCNKLNWINPFFIDPFILSAINPVAPNTYYKSIDTLKKLGLIDYQKGKHNVAKQTVTILKIKNSIKNSINTSIDNSIKYSIEDSIDNSLAINNNTIIQSNNKTIIQSDKKPKGFDFSFFKNYNLNGSEEGFKQLFFDWIKYRNEMKKPYKSQIAIETAFKKIITDSNSDLNIAKKNYRKLNS